MKDGRTHLAHKASHTVDMETGAVVGVQVGSAAAGDTQTVEEAVEDVVDNLAQVMEDPDAAEQLSDDLTAELVADKGYHSNAVLEHCQKLGIRTYISEPNRGRRNWKGKPQERAATYENRRRLKRAKGQRLQRRRGELIERSFAHNYETGGMRRTHLRRHPNILKRLLIHLAGFNLSLVMRQLLGVGTPRALQGRLAALSALLRRWLGRLYRLRRPRWVPARMLQPPAARFDRALRVALRRNEPRYTTAC
jgi:hypothetical protein